MTREEAKNLFRKDRDSYGKVKQPMTKVDKIYDELESRTCENCKHDTTILSCIGGVSRPYISLCEGLRVMPNFGCSKFERKLD